MVPKIGRKKDVLTAERRKETAITRMYFREQKAKAVTIFVQTMGRIGG
jgi:hypothetical protein